MVGRIQCLFFTLTLFSLSAGQLKVDVKSPYAILINAKNGKVLFEKNAHVPIFPASTTKIASLLYILEHHAGALEDVVVAKPSALLMTSEPEKLATNYAAPPHYLEPDGISLGILKNEKFVLRDLLRGAMVYSANDACNVIAEHVAEDVPTFMKKMDGYIQALGCQNTKFCNPHGLQYPEHQTCAYDMALITKKLLENPLTREFIQSPFYTRPRTNLQKARDLKGANKLLRPDSKYFYPKAFGVKTGVHRMGKFNLVAAAEDEDRTLIAVLHKSEKSGDRFEDAIALFEAAFNEVKETRLLFREEDFAFKEHVSHGNRDLVARFSNDVFLSYYPSEEPTLSTKLSFDYSLPISIGQRVGFVSVFDQDKNLLLNEPIFATTPVGKSLYYQLVDRVESKYFLLGLALFGLLIIAFAHKRRGSQASK